jgi:hypothetical protein
MNNLQSCTNNSKLWHLIYKLQLTNGNKKIILTAQERFNLCNYMNGLPYNKNILKKFIK